MTISVVQYCSLVPSLHYTSFFLHIEKKGFFFFNAQKKKMAVETGYEATIMSAVAVNMCSTPSEKIESDN